MPPAEPFGYKKDFLGNKEPVDEQLTALKKAEYYLYQGCSMKSVRDWLVNTTGREISIPGLLKSIKYDKSRRKTARPATEESS